MSLTFNEYAHNLLNDPDEELFAETTVDRFAQAAEEDFSNNYPCIHVRTSLTIVAGTGVYSIPDEVVSIRRITWRGQKVDPLPDRMRREIFNQANQQGKPFWYIFNNIGANQIRFFPIPNESIASISSNLFGSEIGNRVIVDYFSLPDFSAKIIPTYVRRKILKNYMAARCFQIEGSGQNLKSYKYFSGRYDFVKAKYGTLLQQLHNKPRKLVLGGGSSFSSFPASPILPLNRFGISVDTGE